MVGQILLQSKNWIQVWPVETRWMIVYVNLKKQFCAAAATTQAVEAVAVEKL